MINCIGCGMQTVMTGPAQRWCTTCARIKKVESKKRSDEIHFGGHKCKTCDKIIPIEKTYCGYITKPNTCAFKQATIERLSVNKKPTFKKVKQTHRDRSCDASGYF